MTTANPFTTAAKAARERGDIDGCLRIALEGRVVAKLIDHGLSAGFKISVNDGEETVVIRSSDRAVILAACFSTDEDYLIFHRAGDGPGKSFGYVYLVYGNSGYDVISDYGSKDLDAFSAWMKPVEQYTDKLELLADGNPSDGDGEEEEA